MLNQPKGSFPDLSAGVTHSPFQEVLSEFPQDALSETLSETPPPHLLEPLRPVDPVPVAPFKLLRKFLSELSLP